MTYDVDPERVVANLAEIRATIDDACRRSSRSRDSVELLVATKYVGDESLGALVEAGVELVGENQVQSLVEKHERWGDSLTFDFIGHLQSRKAKQVVPLVRLIHSIDSQSALRRIDQAAAGTVDVLLEVNVGDEPTKGGVAPAEVDDFLEQASALDTIRFRGLMTMPPQNDDPDQARPFFCALRELSERLDAAWAGRHSFDVLSMGTSQDFAVAVEEGATIVRLGQRLYE